MDAVELKKINIRYEMNKTRPIRSSILHAPAGWAGLLIR